MPLDRCGSVGSFRRAKVAGSGRSSYRAVGTRGQPGDRKVALRKPCDPLCHGNGDRVVGTGITSALAACLPRCGERVGRYVKHLVRRTCPGQRRTTIGSSTPAESRSTGQLTEISAHAAQRTFNWRPGRVYFLTLLEPSRDDRIRALSARPASHLPLQAQPAQETDSFAAHDAGADRRYERPAGARSSPGGQGSPASCTVYGSAARALIRSSVAITTFTPPKVV